MLRLSGLAVFMSLLLGAAMLNNQRPLFFFNGHIVTMDARNTVAEAFLVQGGRIRAVGSQMHVQSQMQNGSGLSSGWVSGWVSGWSAWLNSLLGVRRLDLHGRTVVPGFVDAHSHFPLNALASAGIEVSSPPFGAVHDISTLQDIISQQADRQPSHRWIIGFNYDNAGLDEQRHPTRLELDKAAPEHPVYLRHRSGHMGVANTKALVELGHATLSGVQTGTAGAAPKSISNKSVIGLSEGAVPEGELHSGLLQDNAPGMQRLIAELAWWRLPSIVFDATDDYLAAGVTTLQNGYADKTTLQILRWAKKLAVIPQRMVFWPAHDKLPDEFSPGALIPDDSDGGRKDLLGAALDWPLDESEDIAIGAIKIIADGSPQGRTAWLELPYKPDAGLVQGYRGLAYMSLLELNYTVLAYHKAGFQLAMHGNGDAAIQAIIDAVSRAQSQYPREDARHIVVHAQIISAEQLQALAQLNVSVTFFPAHTYYWGDWYRTRVLGEARAAQISPLATADAAGVRYSIHADSPVTPMDPMFMLWSATERQTISGHRLGDSERISRLRALRAMTIDAAWQNHLDHDRGSIEVGKFADLVVLSDDPLTVEDVRDVDVQQVWIDGRLRFGDRAE